MDIYICKYKNANELKEAFSKLKNIRNKLIILPFCDGTGYFLTRYYYKILNICKQFSNSQNNNVLLCFYLKKSNIKFVNAIFISKGDVNFLFGESFSNKNMEISFKGKNFLILFYFDLYRKVNLIKKKIEETDFVLGIDDEEEAQFNEYIKNKFFSKIILIEKNIQLVFIKEKNILKKDENIIKLNIQNLT